MKRKGFLSYILSPVFCILTSFVLSLSCSGPVFLPDALSGGGGGGGGGGTVTTSKVPAGFTAAGADRSVILNWNAVTGADYYNVYYATSVASATKLSQNKVTNITPTTTTLTTSGATITATAGQVNSGSIALQNGTEYFFIVSAVVFGVEGPSSYPVSCLPGVPLGNQPFQLRAAGWDQQVILDWHPPSGGGDSYNIYYALTSAGATTSSLNRITGILPPSASSSSTGTSTSTSTSTSTATGMTGTLPTVILTTAGPTITATNGVVNPGSMPLTNGTRYYFIVTAVRLGVEGTPSTFVSTVPSALTSTIPSNVSAVGADRSITVSWSPVETATSYNLYYSTSPSGATTTSSNKVTLIGPTTVTLTTSGGTITATAGVVNIGSIPLTNGITYYFVVTANLPYGEGAASAAVSTMPGICGVNQPCSLSAIARDSQVIVSWVAPVSGADTYNLYYATDPAQLSTPPSTSSKVTGLTALSSVLTKDGTTIISSGAGGTVNLGSVPLNNGTTYYFGVTAVKSGVEGPISFLVSAIPNAYTLVVPWGVVAVGGDSQATISWNSINGATSYNIYYSTDPAKATTGLGTKLSNVGSPYTVSPLTNGTTYYFVVTAVVGGIESADSMVVSATPVAPSPPSAPIQVSAVAGDSLVTVSWPVVTGAVSYNVYYATNSAGATTSSPAKQTGITGTGVTISTIIPGLNNGTTYYFVVTAINSFLLESPPSAVVSATPQMAVTPGAPADVSATSGDRTATISWSAVTGAMSYNIYWDTTQAGATKTSVNKQTGIVGSGYSISVTLPMSSNGTPYYFVVTGVNNLLEGPASPPVSTVPAVPVSGVPVVTAIGGGGSADVSWPAINNATSYNVYWASTQAGATKASSNKQIGVTGSRPVLFTRIKPLTYGSTYYLVVTAVVNGIESSASSPVSVVAQSMGPNWLTTVATDSQIQLGWNTVPGVDGYNVYWATTMAGATTSTLTKSLGLFSAGYSMGLMMTSLTNNSNYYILITSVFNGHESAPSTIVTDTPTKSANSGGSGGITLYATPDWLPHTRAQLSAYPALPTATSTGTGTSTNPSTGTSTVISTSTGTGVVTLNWTTAQYATTYNVYYSTTPTNAVAVSSTTSTTTKIAGLTVPYATVSGLTVGTTYYFVVAPQNPGYEGPVSDIVSSKP